MWRPWVRRKMLNYVLHTLIKMISKIDYREMSSKIINVSKNVDNYNSETWNTKNALKNFFHQKYHHPLPLPSHFFICLENFKNLRNVISYQTVLSGRIVEDAWFFFLSFFFFCPALRMSDQGKKRDNVTQNVLYVLNSLWNFDTPHQKIYVLYLLCESFLPSQTCDCPAVPSYLMSCAIFCIYLSITASLLMFPASLPSAVIDSRSRKGKVMFSLKKSFKKCWRTIRK